MYCFWPYLFFIKAINLIPVCYVMSGDILELKVAMMAASPSLSDKELQPMFPSADATADSEDKPSSNQNHVTLSVADVISRRPTVRQASASTFLCPEIIPGIFNYNHAIPPVLLKRCLMWPMTFTFESKFFQDLEPATANFQPHNCIYYCTPQKKKKIDHCKIATKL